MNSTDETRWHLDRRVPIALISAILIQTAGAIWWAAGMAHRVEGLERDAARMQAAAEVARTAATAQAIQMGRIEEQIGAMRSDVTRLLSAFERRGP